MKYLVWLLLIASAVALGQSSGGNAYVPGSGNWTGSPASPPAIGGTTPAAGTFNPLYIYNGNTLTPTKASILGYPLNNPGSPLSFAAGLNTTTPGTTVSQCNADMAQGEAGDTYYVQSFELDANGGFYYCGSDFTAQVAFYNWDIYSGANVFHSLEYENYAYDGIAFQLEQNNSTTCVGMGTTPAAYNGPCTVLETDLAGLNNYPLAISFAGEAWEQFYGSNAIWSAVGNTTPVKVFNATSTGTSQATVTVGDTNASSTTTIQGPAGGIKLANVSTGTNADFLCLSSGGVVLLQASACTISSLRFKYQVADWLPTERGLRTGALDEIARLRVATYRLKAATKPNADPNYGVTQIGLIAESIAQVEPRCAIYERDMKTPKSYRQECIIAMLVKGEQELMQQNAQLKHRLDRMERMRNVRYH